MQADPSQLPSDDGTSDINLAALEMPDEQPSSGSAGSGSDSGSGIDLSALEAPDQGQLQAAIATGSLPTADSDAKQQAADAAKQLAALNASTVGGREPSAPQPAYDIISQLGHDQLMASDRYRQVYDAALPVLGPASAQQYAKQTIAAEAHGNSYQRDAIASDLMALPKDTALKTNYGWSDKVFDASQSALQHLTNPGSLEDIEGSIGNLLAGTPQMVAGGVGGLLRAGDIAGARLLSGEGLPSAEEAFGGSAADVVRQAETPPLETSGNNVVDWAMGLPQQAGEAFREAVPEHPAVGAAGEAVIGGVLPMLIGAKGAHEATGFGRDHPAMQARLAEATEAAGEDPEAHARIDYVRDQASERGTMWANAELRNLTKNGALRDEAGFNEWRQESAAPEAIVEPTPAETATPEAEATTQAAEALVGKPEAPTADGLPELPKPIVTADEAKAQALHESLAPKVDSGELTPEQADAVKQHMEPARRDSLTGFLAQEHHDPAIERAQQWVEETGQPAQYMTFDLRNIGGLNGKYGHTATNDIISDMAKIVHEEAPASHAELARNGGDEIAGPVYGVTPEQANAIRDRIEERARQYSTENGHDEIANPKYPGDESQKGIGIAGFTSEIVPDVPVNEITRRADEELERRKSNGPSKRDEAGDTGDETQVSRVGSDTEGAQAESGRSVREGGSPQSPGPEPAAEATTATPTRRVNPIRDAAGVSGDVPRVTLRNQQPDAVTMHGYTDWGSPTLNGADGEPLGRLNLRNSNKNLRERFNFSQDRGPEHTHEAVLSNLYPAESDPRGLFDKAREELVRRDIPQDHEHMANEFERQVIHHGFDGVYSDGRGYLLGGKPRLRALDETAPHEAPIEEVPNVIQPVSERNEVREPADVGRENAPPESVTGRGTADRAREDQQGAGQTNGNEKAKEDVNGGNGPRIPAEPERTTAHPPVEKPPTGISNAETERVRGERGTTEPVERAGTKSDSELERTASSELESNPRRGEELAAELKAKPRPITDHEAAVLAMDRKRIETEHHAALDDVSRAMDSKDEAGELAARARAKIAEEAAQRNEEASVHAGTEQGRAFRARQLAASQDYSLSRMLVKAKVSAGRELTAPERARIEEQAKKIEDLQKQLANATAPKRAARPTMVKNAGKNEFQRLVDQFKSLPREEHMTKECAL